MNYPHTVILEHVPCPLGCESDDQTVLTARDLLYDVPGEFCVLKCSSCGLMRTSPRPTPSTIGAYYPDHYGPYLGTRVGPSGKPSRADRVLKSIGRLIFKVNSEALPKLGIGRMLEVGCASGAFLHRMAGKGWSVQGIEFSESAASAARALGYSVHTGSLESAPIEDEPFDLIVGWMVIEHLHDPVGALRKLRAAAKPGAWLAISVPNAGSLEFRIFKKNWYALQLPNHLHHFTPATIRRMFEAAGWKIERVMHQRTLANLIASFGFTLRERGHLKLGELLVSYPERAGRWAYLLYPVSLVFSLLGQTGRMTVWARVNMYE